MKVALLTREYPPHVYGGAGVHVEYLSRELGRIPGLSVEVRRFLERGDVPDPTRPHVATAPEGRPIGPAVRAYAPLEGLSAAAPFASALRILSVDLAMAADPGPDLVHSHTWYTNLAGHLAKLGNGIPHVVTSHSLEPLRPWKAEQLGRGGYALSSFCERTGLESADGIVAVSHAMRADLLKAYPAVEPDRVTVIHNGIDPEEYRPDPGTDALEAHGVDPNRPTVLFVGRVTRQKGISHLLDAAAMIDRDAQLVCLAGAADTEDLEREVAGKVALVGAARPLVWIDGMAPKREVIQFLSHATVFVCPSVYEPLGIVNLEAMACGAPVVATATGGIPEVVEDGVTGYLVPFEPKDAAGTPADPKALAAALADRIDRLLADPELAARFGAAGRERVLAHFTWSAIAERTASLYLRLLLR